ncbi:MAG: DUF559 domain-containing protein [Alphaproteobacteria bacterium]|nr:DUF559 domain-containing protein [Alphaproteobacteria bacterium]
MREKTKRSRRFASKLRVTMTEAEVILWSQLKKRAQRSALFRRQHPIGPYVADFACIAAKLVFEIDGATHSEDEEIAHDLSRTACMERDGWMVLRFTNDDVYRRLGPTLDAIWNAVDFRLRQDGAAGPPSVWPLCGQPPPPR